MIFNNLLLWQSSKRENNCDIEKVLRNIRLEILLISGKIGNMYIVCGFTRYIPVYKIDLAQITLL